MNKAKFTYVKEDNSESFREILMPKFLKESYNSYNAFDKENVKYVQGYEIDKTDLSLKEAKEYEEILSDYFNLTMPSIDEYFKENGLDPSKIKTKIFKKERIKDFFLLSDSIV